MILLSAPTRSGPPFKKNETLRHFTDARKQKTIHKYNKNWKDLDFDFGLDGFENGIENGFEKKKKKVGGGGGGGGYEVNWKKKMKKDILRLFRGDGSWYENLDNTVSKIQQTIVGQLFPFLVFGGGAPPRGGEVVVGGDPESDFFKDLEEFIRMIYEFLNEKSKTKYKTVTETKAQIKNLIEIILKTNSFNNSSNDYTKKLFEKFITDNNDFIAKLKILFNDSGYNNYSFTDNKLNEKINKKIDEVLKKIDEKLKQTEKDKALKNSVFAILKYCLESIAATTATAAATTEDNEDQALLEESEQIPEEDIDPNADEILSIKEIDTTNNDMDAKNRSVRIKTPMNYYEKMNHDLQNIMMMGTEGQREVVNHVDPKSYFEENEDIEDIDKEMDAEIIGKPEVVVNIPETLADGYSDLSRATVFVDPEKVVKNNRNVDEIFSKNNREMVDETMFLNYPRVMTEEEAEILGVMSPMKLAACAMLKYCSVPVKGFWSDTVWNGLKKGLGVLGTGISNAPSNVKNIGVKGVGYVKNLYNENQEKKILEKEQKKLDTNRKQAGLAILKYCLGGLKNDEEEQKHRKQASLAILKYCLENPVRDTKNLNYLKKLYENFKLKNPFSNMKFPDWVLWWKQNQPTVTPIAAAPTPETILQKSSMAILKYCLEKERVRFFQNFIEKYGKHQIKKASMAILKYCLEKEDTNIGDSNSEIDIEENKVDLIDEPIENVSFAILKYCLDETEKQKIIDSMKGFKTNLAVSVDIDFLKNLKYSVSDSLEEIKTNTTLNPESKEELTNQLEKIIKEIDSKIGNISDKSSSKNVLTDFTKNFEDEQKALLKKLAEEAAAKVNARKEASTDYVNNAITNGLLNVGNAAEQKAIEEQKAAEQKAAEMKKKIDEYSANIDLNKDNIFINIEQKKIKDKTNIVSVENDVNNLKENIENFNNLKNEINLDNGIKNNTELNEKINILTQKIDTIKNEIFEKLTKTINTFITSSEKSDNITKFGPANILEKVIHKLNYLNNYSDLLKFLDKENDYNILKQKLENKKTLFEEQKAKEEAEQKAAEEAARIKAEEAARIKAEEAARIKAEEEAKIKAEEEAKIKAEEEEAAKIKAEEEAARIKAEEAARIKAEEEEAARIKAEKEAKIKAEEEEAAKIKAEEEAARIKAEEAAKIKAEEEEAKIKAEEAARIKAEKEAKIKAEEEEEAKIKAEEEEEEAKIKAEEEAKIKAEEEEAARLQSEEEAARIKEEAARIKEEAARLEKDNKIPISYQPSRKSLNPNNDNKGKGNVREVRVRSKTPDSEQKLFEPDLSATKKHNEANKITPKYRDYEEVDNIDKNLYNINFNKEELNKGSQDYVRRKRKEAEKAAAEEKRKAKEEIDEAKAKERNAAAIIRGQKSNLFVEPVKPNNNTPKKNKNEKISSRPSSVNSVSSNGGPAEKSEDYGGGKKQTKSKKNSIKKPRRKTRKQKKTKK